tara:strand:+ start:789 stop:914 length:126 start_codon:yes stop_codon:yes gene_type:complete
MNTGLAIVGNVAAKIKAATAIKIVFNIIIKGKDNHLPNLHA